MAYKAYTRQERLERLNRMYDGAADYCVEAVETGQWKGTAAAILMLERSREEMKSLIEMDEANGVAIKKQSYTLGFLPDEPEQAQVDAYCQLIQLWN